MDTTGGAAATELADQLRRAGLAVERGYDQRSMKAQMKLADRSGARLALLVGPQELAAGEITMRDLRSDDLERGQQRLGREGLVAVLLEHLNK